MGVMNKFMNFLGLQDEEEIVERVRSEENDSESEYNFAEQRKNKGNVVGLPSMKPTKMVLSEPRSYDETQEIADHLRQRRPVLVNLQRVRQDQAIRIVDFLSGTVYALNGGISKVGHNIFLCTPDTVEIHGNITEILDGETDYKKSR
jgi:cell division inhibitor SepF